ncbi:MAG TPA: TolC family protein [Terracidiphilus sp.]|nr:TolC family protein [Terracidiphilus sp.]
MRDKRVKIVGAVCLALLAGSHRIHAQESAGAAAEARAEDHPKTPVSQKELPAEPQPQLTPLLREGRFDYAKPATYFHDPFAPYLPRTIEAPRLSNTPLLKDLLRDGKIYLSLSDAVSLAIENNSDIAIARYNLDIADTDLLRARAGSSLRGVSTGIVANTLGGNTATITGGGGPGGTSSGSGGSGAGASGLVLSTNGAGPAPEALDPALTGMAQVERATTPESTQLLNGTNFLKQNTNQFNFGYTQGFLLGTALSVTFNNERVASNSERTFYSPLLQSYLQAKVQQPLLQGFGIWLNKRPQMQARNNRQITDASFRQQLLYTINQVEDIYWALVSAWEDEHSKEHALEQSRQLAADNRRQFEVGTMARLEVMNADSQVANDEQALMSARNNLEYQQLLMKQAVARDLEDPHLSSADVVPTDRVSLAPSAEEQIPVEQLIHQADANSPEAEQAALTIKNDEITLRAVKNGLLPVVDIYGYYSANALGGAQNPHLSCGSTSGPFVPCPAGTVTSSSYGTTFTDLFNNRGPDSAVGVSISIPIRNRTAQADQIRSQLEYRQAQIRLQQIYTQIRIQIINSRYAVTNDRAQVKAALAAQEYATENLDAEKQRFRIGDSTTADVLAAQRNLATADDNVISAKAAYARDRAALYQISASTLDRYGIDIVDAAKGDVGQTLKIPGLAAPGELEPSASAQSPGP